MRGRSPRGGVGGPGGGGSGDDDKKSRGPSGLRREERGEEHKEKSSSSSNWSTMTVMIGIPSAVAVLVLGILLPIDSSPFSKRVWAQEQTPNRTLPALAQVIDQKGFNVLDTVLPPAQANASTLFLWPGVTAKCLTDKPFHVYDDEFYDIIGPNPTLTRIAASDGDPIFHEAVIWYPPTDEVFFVQNAGAPAAGTGLNKSAIIQKISVAQADAVKSSRDAVGQVNVTIVNSNPQVINPNGGTNYKDQLLFAGEGQGDNIPSALYLMNPREPHNTTVLINNYFGRQFNALNDIGINPRNMDIYFTDPIYGYLQDFRPAPGLRRQVYRLTPATGAVAAVADGFIQPNGIAFSPDGSHAYLADTGANQVFWGWNYSNPSTIYRYDVQEDGTWENRKTFAYIASGVPDGVHCDANGNVYAGCGDGVHVWNPSGKLIGKIYLGTTSANFQFAGDGKMVICAETELYYATLAAKAGPIL